MPYALTVGAVAALLGFLPAGLGVPVYINLLLGVIALYIIVKYFGASVKEEDLQQYMKNEDNVDFNYQYLE